LRTEITQFEKFDIQVEGESKPFEEEDELEEGFERMMAKEPGIETKERSYVERNIEAYR
jgi:hypothetical protein